MNGIQRRYGQQEQDGNGSEESLSAVMSGSKIVLLTDVKMRGYVINMSKRADELWYSINCNCKPKCFKHMTGAREGRSLDSGDGDNTGETAGDR